jgi:hypothetical protein
MTHTGESAGQHNDNNDKDVMGYALPRRENESVPVGLAVRDTMSVTDALTYHEKGQKSKLERPEDVRLPRQKKTKEKN